MLWSDHVIQDREKFADVLDACFQSVEDHPDALVSVGANPTEPDTGLGYIRMGETAHRYGDITVFKVRQFVEKPDLATAKKFLASWEYLWNVGYNVIRAEYFLSELRRVQPDLIPVLDRLTVATTPEAIAEAYEDLPRISLDYLLVQKLQTQLVIPADIGWSDIGNWNTLHEVLKGDDDMVVRGEVVQVDSSNTLVFAKDRPIALVGVKNLIIVDDGDALLVMAKDSAQSLKHLITDLEERNQSLL
jgi:mannose-1-phosphate guanylyltransferase